MRMAEFEALKEFSVSLATLSDHWETSLEEVTGQTAMWFVGLGSGKHEKRPLDGDYQ